jgi:porin
MQKRKLIVVIFSMVFSVTAAWAQDATTQSEIDELKQRIEELEKKQTDSEATVGEIRQQLPSPGLEIAKKVAIGGVLSGVYQYESVSGPPDIDDRGRGAISFQPEISITPTEHSEIFFALGFAAGNGLAGVTSFNLAPWAAGVEDDVKNINGRGRDYLLQAWYGHTFEFGDDHNAFITGGIIDGTDYLDDNAYANDEYTQFMNEALVNGPNTFIPSWDIGGAGRYSIGDFSITGVYMNVGENDAGNNFNFFGGQLAYNLKSSLGEGNYRALVNGSSEAFPNPEGTSLENRVTLGISFDQELGESFGAWIRWYWQDDSALVDYKAIYSGGVFVSGNLWGREQDHIGIGYAYLDGAEQTEDSLKNTHVGEAYVSFGLHEYLSLTFDIQYMKDSYVLSENDVDGWIAGVRATCEF